MHILNHRTLSNMIVAGAHELVAREQELNAINLFPVPDGDTGSNLAYLMRMIMRESHSSDTSSTLLERIQRACLRGSRGNSGMIFSQFIISMCSYMSARSEVQSAQFVEMCEQSAAKSRRAVQDPKEGTVLSVMDDWVHGLKSTFTKADGIPELLRRSFAEVSASLERTRQQLDVLRKHNVVDAGAKGFVHFLQGFIASLGDTFGTIEATDPAVVLVLPAEVGTDASPHSPSDLKHRYCTEFLFDVRTELEEIKRRIAPMGDSIVVVGDRDQGKIHIHTDSPAQVAEVINSHGQIMYQKVEDMKRQNDMIYNRQASIALVIDSACDIHQRLLDEHQIHLLPLHLQIGRSTYLDKVTIQSDTFYDKLDRLTEQPTTSQPDPDTISMLYKQLLAHYDHVISIHLARPLSGTFDACRQAAETIDPQRIHVVDSRTLSGAYGLVVHRTAEAIRAGRAIEEVLAELAASIPRSDILVSVPTLKHMIRGGRVSPLQGKIARWLDMKPIVSVDSDGRSRLYGATFFKRSNLDKMLRMISRMHDRNPIRQYVVLHAENEAASARCEEEMVRITGQRPLYVASVSPVIGLHAGKGAVSIAMMASNDHKRGTA